MPRMKQIGGMVKKSGDTMTGALTLDSTLSGAIINNQFSNMLAAQLLDISSTLKFLNTLTGAPVTDASNMIDVSGAAHNGTYKGTWAAAQRVNKGFGWMLSPNGTDNYVNLGDSDDFSFGDGTNDVAFTVAFVGEVVDTALYQEFIDRWDLTTGLEKREFRIAINTSEKLIVLLFDESLDIQIYKVTNGVISSGFHTFVVTYSGVGGATAANGITIYVDGAVVASTASNNANYVAMENTTALTMLGAQINTSGLASEFISVDFTPPIIDKGTVWTAAQVNRFHQVMKGVFNL